MHVASLLRGFFLGAGIELIAVYFIRSLGALGMGEPVQA